MSVKRRKAAPDELLSRSRIRPAEKADSSPMDALLQPNAHYLDRLMRRQSFQALWPLFAHATKPAKELTESFSALVHLRPYLKRYPKVRVLHIGDGAHARTGALFALKTRAENISIDPVTNQQLIQDWINNFQIERLSAIRQRAEDAIPSLANQEKLPTMLTFVHAHVDTDAVIGALSEVADVKAAFVLGCCQPGKQFSSRYPITHEGEDEGVLSPDRHFQVIEPQQELGE